MQPRSCAAAGLTAWLAAVLTAGCAASSTVADPVQPGPSRTSAAHGVADPSALVGSWRLDAAGEPAGAILTIGDRVDGGLLLFHACGMLSGYWRANRHAMFVGELDGGDSACFRDKAEWRSLRPRWLTSATQFATDGKNETLLDAGGAVVATLRPGGHPAVGMNDSPDYVKKPVVTAQMRESWREPSPLPDGVRPVSSAQLLHRWVPVRSPGSRAYVTFTGDARYEGSDGCNGLGGRYLLGADGIVLATSGASTLIGCENNPLPSWVAVSGRLGVRAGRLVFVSPTGKVLGEAARAT